MPRQWSTWTLPSVTFLNPTVDLSLGVFHSLGNLLTSSTQPVFACRNPLLGLLFDIALPCLVLLSVLLLNRRLTLTIIT